MIIGLDGSRAFLKYRTGIEEYAYQTIKHLREVLPADAEVRLYVRKKFILRRWRLVFVYPEIDFALPANWKVRGIWAPRFWTQAGLSLEMLLYPVEALFVPAHTVPVIHPKNTVVTVHGLEYEIFPKAYSWWARIYMPLSIRYSVKAAKTIICVSENTKRDVMRLYKVPAEKITVVYEGYEERRIGSRVKESHEKPYLLFLGRLEERKNVVRIIEAFDILKGKLGIPHALVLAGKRGYGYDRIGARIQASKFKEEVIERGYISEEDKWRLLRDADAFVFPSYYEGFGIPVLEAQSMGTPVVTSEVSSLPEVGGEGAVYVDPDRVESIAEGIQLVLTNEGVRNDIIKKATLNVGRFSWASCAQGIFRILLDGK